ncbi:MAG: dockerin type I domain-containing protein [candidate division Zixibacteria bacterium]
MNTLFRCNCINSRRFVCLLLVLMLALSSAPVNSDSQYICGDANGDGRINLNDVLFIVSYTFLSGPPPEPYESGDVNCDEWVNVGDIVYLINTIFRDGRMPCEDCPQSN